ncbi:MAG: type II toxin-antitoxin system PemK/MazF family toxin [Pseudomonadota bacterium]
MPSRNGRTTSTRPTTVFDPGAIVRVPFPFVERNYRRVRPALVITSKTFTERTGLVWTLMITSMARERWPDDVPIADHERSGLPIASMVRVAKIATIEARDLSVIGRIDSETLASVHSKIKDSLLRRSDRTAASPRT